jgi:PiT family inorganic phosphate transporter
MLLLSVALFLLVFLAVMLVSGNNLSACVGPSIGSRIVTKRLGILIGAIGFSIGLLLQGSGMTKSVGILLPNASPELRVEALIVAILVFVIAYWIRVPMSLNMSLVGLLAGLSIAGNSSTSGLFVAEVVLTWIAIPIIALAVAYYLIRFLNTGLPTNFWHRLRTYKAVLIVTSFTTAYVTGANTLGMIVATGGFNLESVLAAITAIFIGSFFLSEGAIRRVSEEFFLMRYANATVTLVTSTVLVEIATIFNIPLSITQTTSVAVFGAGLSYRTRLVSAKPFLKILVGWVVAPLLSFAIGLLIG